MRNPLLLSGLIACLSVTGAFAQDEARDGFYLRAGAGVSFVDNLDQDFTYDPAATLPAPATAGQTIASETGFVATAAVGFDYADGIRTELEYRYASSGVESVTPAVRTGLPAPVNDELNAHFILSNFYYDFRNSSPLTPFIGLGVGGAFVENENADRDAALAYQGRAGISYAFNDGFSADVEYVYLRTNDLVYGPADDDFADSSDIVRIDNAPYVSSSIMISLRKQF